MKLGWSNAYQKKLPEIKFQAALVRSLSIVKIKEMLTNQSLSSPLRSQHL